METDFSPGAANPSSPPSAKHAARRTGGAGSGERPVALVAPNLDGGGAELVTLRLAEGLAGRGLPVEVVVARAEGAFLERVPTGVPFRNLDAGAPVLLWKTLKLARYLRKSRPRAVLSSLDVAGAAVWARQLAKARQLAGVSAAAVPVVLWEHTNLTHQFEDKYGRFGGALRKALLRASRRRADAVVAVSRGVASDLQRHVPRLDPERLHVAYNPVVTPEVLAQAEEPAGHPWLSEGGDEAPPVILGVGRLTAQKDFPTLLRAFARVRSGRPARLLILGEPPAGDEHVRGELEALARQLGVREDVDLAGFKDNPYAYMAAADVFALSSAYEGFGMVLVEAMATGTPVASTDCPSGPAEILEDGRYGPLVPVGDPAALADGLRQALANPVPADALRERAMDFSLERSAERHAQIIASLSSASS